ncbi:hypothetical protein BH11CYA1_BH11CYA1_35510 [soil metagenome]|jgi:hypothetical protein
MNETTLSNDERRCLQMWFRQAIAKLELEEVTDVMLKEYPVEVGTDSPVAHRPTTVSRRRVSRSRLTSHLKELIV